MVYICLFVCLQNSPIQIRQIFTKFQEMLTMAKVDSVLLFIRTTTWIQQCFKGSLDLQEIVEVMGIGGGGVVLYMCVIYLS